MIADETVHRLYRDGRLGGAGLGRRDAHLPRGRAVEDAGDLEPAHRRAARGSASAATAAIVALGGGVAGDLAGFVAATYMRGVPYVQVPTTLLAMLDASVGGKTGVDTPQGKNLIGAFHPPVAVLADPLVLATLPDREYRAGLAEAVKHGLIADRELLRVDGAGARTRWSRRDAAALQQLVRRSVEIKAEVVSEDEREGGRRAILNAGHTVAHALEQATGVSRCRTARPWPRAGGRGARWPTGLGLATPEAGARAWPRCSSGSASRPGSSEPVGADRVLAAMAQRQEEPRRRDPVRAAAGGRERWASGPEWTTEAGEPAIRAALRAIS